MTVGGYAPWPVFDDEQVAAATEVLRSGRVNYWTGDHGRLFEEEFAAFTGVSHAVFVANGTVGLEAAIEALDLPAGSDVVTTPRTFIASSSAVIRRGHRPVFADVDPDSGNITAASILEAMTPRTRAVLVVHLGGWPADMPAIRHLCDERGLRLIEDCSQAHGAMIGHQHVGTFGDIAVWSFCQDKIISTAGEGGMVATNNLDLARRVWSIKDHGKSWDAVYEREHAPGFRWLHETFGSNYRGTEVQAAIGRIQYRRLESWRDQRTSNAGVLTGLLADTPGVSVPVPEAGLTHAYYRLYAYLDLTMLDEGWSRDRILSEAEAGAEGPLPVLSGSCSEIYREVAFDGTDAVPSPRLPTAQLLGDNALAFLVHPGLSVDELTATATSIARKVRQATSVRVA